MKLKIGDKIPHFKAKDANGDEFDSLDVVGYKPLVIYFYPKDNTLGCTAQACNFRNKYMDFTDLGAEVIGISDDGSESHKNFSKQYKLPFTLLSDNEGKIKKMFGVSKKLFGLLPGRVTFVVDKKGVVQSVFDSLLPTKHSSKALQVLEELISNSD